MKILLCPNPYRDFGLKTALLVKNMLEERGVGVLVALSFDDAGDANIPEGISLVTMSEAIRDVDVIICFGGDGTILHLARDAATYGVPILGVNMGTLGFMAEIDLIDINRVTDLVDGDFVIETRMMIDAVIERNGKPVHSCFGLNDAVVNNGGAARIIELTVMSDDDVITRFGGDGLIMSTPTGSTAYSMAAGGPIVEPCAENIIVTPICAHTVQAKSFVLMPDRRVTVKVGDLNRKSAYLSVDGGNPVELETGDHVVVTKSRYATKLIKILNLSFYEAISLKLDNNSRRSKL